MTRFGRFIVLALVGFALGAGLAYYQHSRDAATTSDIVAGAPEMPTADNSAVDPNAAMTATDPVAGSTIGGAFTLVDHNGVEVTEASYPGKLKLVFFGFANCPDICPATLDKLSTALGTLGTQAEQIQPLFITTDAARDTPDALKSYLITYPAFTGLTGTEEQTKAAADAYKVYVSPAADGNIDHSAYVYLMSADNQLLETFGKDDTADAVAEKIKTHLTAGTPAADTAPVAATEGAVIDETTTSSDAATGSDAVSTDATETTTSSDEAVDAPASEESSATDTVVPETVTPDTPAGGLDAPSTSPTEPVNTP